MLVFVAAIAGAGLLWNYVGVGRSAVGVGEGLRAQVVSPYPASVVNLLVEPHTMVRRGDPLAILQPFNPDAPLNLLQSRLDLARLASTPSLAEENAIQLERLRIEWVQIRSELAVAKVRLEFAERDLARNEPLYRDRLVPEDIYELSRSNRDLWRAEVTEKSKAVEEVGNRLAHWEASNEQASTKSIQASLLEDFARVQTSVSTNWSALTLVAPMDGIVGGFLRQPGEFLVEGEPLVTVHSSQATHIVAYLRQPFGLEPLPGLPVRVSRRLASRERFDTSIRHVGPQFETITNSLALVRVGALVDSGLPIIVDIPAHISVRPGEVVDLIIRSGTTFAHGAIPPAPAQP
jgi:multidrug resistance efflux pump